MIYVSGMTFHMHLKLKKHIDIFKAAAVRVLLLRSSVIHGFVTEP